MQINICEDNAVLFQQRLKQMLDLGWEIVPGSQGCGSYQKDNPKPKPITAETSAVFAHWFWVTLTKPASKSSDIENSLSDIAIHLESNLRPSVIYKPEITDIGDVVATGPRWRAALPYDCVSAPIAGYGPTPAAALQAFDAAFFEASGTYTVTDENAVRRDKSVESVDNSNGS